MENYTTLKPFDDNDEWRHIFEEETKDFTNEEKKALIDYADALKKKRI